MQTSFRQALSTKLLIGVATLAGLAQAVPALADTPPPPAPTPAFSWTGVYIGPDIGKVTGESTWNGPAGVGEFGGNDGDTLHDRSVTYGGQIGYNYQISHDFLVGVEGSLHGSHQASGNTYTGGEGYNGLTSIGVRSQFGGDVSARAGVTLDHFLFYGKGGVAFDHFDYSATDSADVAYSAAKTRTGFLIGAGLEVALDHHWSLKGEYNHIGYTTKAITLTGSDGSTLTPTIGESTNTFKFGVNYRF